jgi:hypothetical protein
MKFLLFPTITIAVKGSYIQQRRDDTSASEIPNDMAVHICSSEKQRALERDFVKFSDLFCHWMVAEDPKPSQLLERDYIWYKEMHSFSVIFNPCFIKEDDPGRNQDICKQHLGDMLAACMNDPLSLLLKLTIIRPWP